MAHTSIVKTLQKIANSECQRKASGGSKSGGSKRSTAKGAQEVKFHMPSKDVIECLAASSAGDIRSAINALQFACLKGESTNLHSCGINVPTCMHIVWYWIGV